MKLIHALVFVFIYLRELTLSTIRIAVLVLSPNPQFHPCFIEVPLELKGGLPRFLLASLVTMTPGTMSVGLDMERDVLLVHAMDAPDAEAAVREMKQVLEAPLIRIFGRTEKPNHATP